MKLTSQGQRRAAALGIPDDDGFEALREEFCQRLRSERLRLLNLSAALAHGDAGRTDILDELRNRAHRLSGTAAIFEFTDVAALARVLELAVNAASTPTESNTDAVICAALHALIRLLGRSVRQAPPAQGRPGGQVGHRTYF